MSTRERWRERAASPDVVLLDGFHALKHALRFGAEVPLAVAADKPAALALARELAPELTDRLAALLTPVPARELAELLAGQRPHPTGVAALAQRPRTSPFVPWPHAPTVLLDNPRHLGNVGAVVRLVAGAGAGGVITTGTVDPWHPNAVRASAGLHFATAVARGEPPAADPADPADQAAGGSAADWLPGEPPAGLPLYALDPAGEDIRGVEIPDRAVLAFGSERAGLSAGVRARANRLVALPMRPNVSSYNLATSVAMTLFHWMSHRHVPPDDT